MDFECPKCNKWGMEWDGRAKTLRCPYYDCEHIIKVEGYDHHGIPSDDEIRSIIEDDKDMANDKITLKYMRRVYYTSRARPETHELNVSKKDSIAWLTEYHRICEPHLPFAMFVDQVKNGDGAGCFFKGIPVNFFTDNPTQFVSKETDLTYVKGTTEKDTANMP